MTSVQEKEIFFHVGLPRTASTFLQRNFFPFLNDVHFIKKHDFGKRTKIVGQSAASKVLLSTEMDIGKPGRYESLKAVAREYPHAKTIIVLRRHDSWIKSKFFYYIRKGGALDFEEFFNFENTGFFKIEHLGCMNRLAIIESYFPGKPLVIFFEELKNNPEKTLDTIANYMGVAYDKDKISKKSKNSAFKLNELKAILKFNKIAKHRPEKIKNPYLRSQYIRFFGVYIRVIIVLVSIFRIYKKDSSELISQAQLNAVKDYFNDDWEKAIAYEKQSRALYL